MSLGSFLFTEKGEKMIITKDLSKGDVQISEHFRLSEFKSPGSNIVKYDTEILEMLEKIRKFFGGGIEITSGYRTPAYNKKVFGASNSAHLYGQAVDFKVEDKDGDPVSSKSVCLFLEEIGWKYGIGYINTATHFDTKFLANHMDETRAGTTTKWYRLTTTFAKYFGYKTRTVIVPTLNVRSGAGTEYPVVGRKVLGNKVTAFARKFDTKGKAWVKISYIHKKWVAERLTK
jgi:hypothetical protein